MTLLPATRYISARDGAHLAVQQFGSGPDLVVMVGGFSHVEMRWEEPRLARSWRRLGSFARVTTFDPRGSGLSDRSAAAPALATRIEDVIDVLGSLEVGPAAFLATFEAGVVALQLAADHPERVTRLVLESTLAKARVAPGYPEGIGDEVWDVITDLVATASLQELCDLVAPSRASEPAFRDWFGKWARNGSGPGGLSALLRWIESVDVRDVLARVQCPVAVVHSTNDPLIPFSAARYMAERLPNGVLVEVDHDTGWFSDAADLNINTLEQVITGRAGLFEDRMRCALLMCDLIRSTPTAAALGDARWRNLLDDHDRLVDTEVRRGGGTIVNTTGDGALAVFPDSRSAVAVGRALGEVVGTLGLSCRVGVHVGEVVRRGNDVAGLAAHVVARICSLAEGGQVLMSEETAREVGWTTAVGSVELRGVPGTWTLHEAIGA